MTKPGNINDPTRSVGKYVPYTYQGIAKEKIKSEKTFDLNSLHFTIDDFQEMSKGKYNAGELMLTKSGKLDIVNNHKTWTILNHKDVDGEDSYAIRVAFANALERAGVSTDNMKVIRESLGLGADNSIKGSGAFLPLKRQEVRLIIDKFINDINKNRDDGDKLKTYKELHAKYTKEERKEIRAERKTLNATNLGNGLRVDIDLYAAVRVATSTDFSDLNAAEAEDYVELLDELEAAVENLFDDQMRADWSHENSGYEYRQKVFGSLDVAREGGNVVLLSSSGGKSIRIPLGMNKDKLLAQLEKAKIILEDIVEPDEPEVDSNPDMDAEKANAKTIKNDKKGPGKLNLIENDDNLKMDAEMPKIKPNVRTIKNDKNGLGDKLDLIEDDDNPKMNAENPTIGMMERKPKNVQSGVKNKFDELIIEFQKESEERKVQHQKRQNRKIEIEIEKPEVDKNAEYERAAKTNYRTLVTAMSKFYGEQFKLEEGEIEDIIKSVDNWEWKLSNCDTKSGDTIQTLNEDLRNFLLENQSVIQTGIDRAIADK